VQNTNVKINMCEPAHTVVTKLGGVGATCKHLKVSRNVIYMWLTPKRDSNKATGGVIPLKHWKPLLELSRSKGIDLKLQDLFGNQV